MQLLMKPHRAQDAAHALPAANAGRRSAGGTGHATRKARLIALLIAGVVTLIGAGAADAHDGAVAIDCETVTITFTNFPHGRSQVDYTIKVDNVTTAQGSLTVTSHASSTVIPNHVTGNHTVSVFARWSADGGSSVAETRTLTCAAPPVAPAPAPVAAATPAALPAPVAAPVAAAAPAPVAVSAPLAIAAAVFTPSMVDVVRSKPVPVSFTAQPPLVTCNEPRRMVKGKCVRETTQHVAAKPENVKKQKRVGVLGSKKSKVQALPFTK